MKIDSEGRTYEEYAKGKNRCILIHIIEKIKLRKNLNNDNYQIEMLY